MPPIGRPGSPRLDEATWTAVRDADPGRTVALLPTGAVEAHGPHLPLGTDTLIAAGMAREGAARLAREGIHAWILPPIPYAPAPFAAGFPGTVPIRSETLGALLADIAEALARQGFRALGIANAHFDPAQVTALREAVDRIRSAGRIPVAFPDLTRRDLAARLTDEFRSGACHAGRFEGSIVLADRPDLVDEDVRASLPPNPRSLVDAIRAGKTDFAAAGGPDAYFGDPAKATAEEGRATLRVLGEILAESVRSVLAE